MQNRRIRLTLAVLIAMQAAILTAGCGGDENEAGTTTGTSTTAQTTEVEQAESSPEPSLEDRETTGSQRARKQGSADRDTASGGEAKPGSGDEAEGRRIARIAEIAARSDRQPSAGAVAPGVPVVRGGDNSIQEFGAEGSFDDSGQALTTLSTYLVALSRGEWQLACANASQQFHDQLAMLNERLQKGEPFTEDCSNVLERITAPVTKEHLRANAQINELLSFRVENAYAYVVYRRGDDELRFIAMANDDGQWKVNALQPEAFQGGPE